ncbi:DUF4232 domain-containing protein [Streptomyces sp. SID2888]|uniref:DUF4232 domain-containing protein n=1 Tax=Streptomyces sp. SID2888 TaxID=2690256 RepID=UPI00136D1C8B|nr:DUF4232 domain-containing protein [Streptomyces sp. SID2888]MYV45824.1 DUF4232 domain-containing protein [Streptomyces sp. SID2888]
MRCAPLTPLTLPAALAGLLLLTACGSQTADASGDGPARTGVSGSPGDACGARSSVAMATPDAPEASREGGVRITDMGDKVRGCTRFEVTNQESEPFTFMVTFTFLGESGGALENVERTVASVGSGKTVRRTVTWPTLHSDAGSAQVKVLKVRSVPAAEAPSSGGPCPRSGVRVYADDGDAAMGLRVVGLHLANCGTGVVHLNGYPRLQLLDEDHKPVEGVAVLRGGASIASGTGADGTPEALDVQPGERAHATLVWRNTVTGFDGAVNAPYVRVWANTGAAPVTVVPELDLGTTGKLGVGPWKQDEDSEADAPGRTGTP